jgi:hypothetical protein
LKDHFFLEDTKPGHPGFSAQIPMKQTGSQGTGNNELDITVCGLAKVAIFTTNVDTKHTLQIY